MIRIEHWADSGMLVVVLREDVEAVSAREVSPGIVFHYAQRPGEAVGEDPALDNRDVVFIEIEAARGRPVSEVVFERYDDEGRAVYRSPDDPEGAVVHFRAAIEHLAEAGIVDASEFMPHKKREPKAG